MPVHIATPEYDYAETGNLVENETRERLRRCLMALVEWSRRFEGRRQAGETA